MYKGKCTAFYWSGKRNWQLATGCWLLAAGGWLECQQKFDLPFNFA